MLWRVYDGCQLGQGLCGDCVWCVQAAKQVLDRMLPSPISYADLCAIAGAVGVYNTHGPLIMSAMAALMWMVLTHFRAWAQIPTRGGTIPFRSSSMSGVSSP